MKFLSLSKNKTESKFSCSSSPWASCHQPKTHSFRISTAGNGNDSTKHKNDVVLVDSTPESFFTESPHSASFSTVSSESRDPLTESVIRGARSERLFFEPDESSSILGPANLARSGAFHLVAMDSKNPYVDFRGSMEEMVDSHGVKDWKSLEELLHVYLKVNGESNHRFIVDAFFDLLVALAFGNDDKNNDRCDGVDGVDGVNGGASSSLEGEEENKEVKRDEFSSSSFHFY